MAAPATNQELTDQILLIKGQLAVFESNLEGLLIPMQNEISTSRTISDKMTDDLNKHINPLIQADLKTVIEKVGTETKGMIKLLDDRVADLMKTVSTNDANTSRIQDALTVEMKNAVNRQDVFSQEVDKHRHEINFEKNQADQRYAQTQSQVALATSQNSQSSGGSARRSNDPLVTHKLLINKAPLDGSESHDVFDDWYNDMADDFELLLPGSKAIMKLAEKSTEPCTTDWMMRQDNAGLACTHTHARTHARTHTHTHTHTHTLEGSGLS